MTTSNKHFLVNTLTSELTFKAGALNIAPLSFKEIFSWDLEDETIKYALGRGWAQLTDKEPDVPTVVKGPEIEITEPYEGLSEEELKAELAAKSSENKKEEAPAPEPEPVVETKPTKSTKANKGA